MTAIIGSGRMSGLLVELLYKIRNSYNSKKFTLRGFLEGGVKWWARRDSNPKRLIRSQK